jgi:hypothetical protein
MPLTWPLRKIDDSARRYELWWAIVRTRRCLVALFELSMRRGRTRLHEKSCSYWLLAIGSFDISGICAAPSGAVQ